MDQYDDNQSQNAEPRPDMSAAPPVERAQPLVQAHTQQRLLGKRLLESNFPSYQTQDSLRISSRPQAFERCTGVWEIHRLQETQVAFSANSEVVAAIPRRSLWRGGNPLPAPQNTQGSTEQHQDQETTPRLALGTINADRLGEREAARRHVLQWDGIYEFNKIRNPGSAQVVDKHRTEAKRVYEELLASEQDENILPRNTLVSYQNGRIQACMALLWKTLLKTPEQGYEPMKDNITAALKGYNTGIIGFSVNYTLIYAGRVMDTTCTSYSEFTVDRQQRLDSYSAEYGPGYLWWEPPLAKGRERVLAKKSTVLNLDREDESFCFEAQQAPRFQDDACHYKVPMGFQEDDSIRRRVRSCRKRSVVAKETHTESVAAAKRKQSNFEKSPREPKKRKLEHELIAWGEATRSQGDKEAPAASSTSFDQEQSSMSNNIEYDKASDNGAPTMFFDVLLDSSAELPSILHDDFELLGYSKEDMNAACVVELSAAAGQTSTALCFELRVGRSGKLSRTSHLLARMPRPVYQLHTLVDTRATSKSIALSWPKGKEHRRSKSPL